MIEHRQIFNLSQSETAMETSANKRDSGYESVPHPSSLNESAVCCVILQPLESSRAEQAPWASLAWAPCCPVPGVLFTAAASLSLRNPKLCAGTRSDADEIAQNRKVNTFCQLPLYIHRENNNRNVLKHKRTFYSNCSKKKNASQTASSLRHQTAWLTAF